MIVWNIRVDIIRNAVDQQIITLAKECTVAVNNILGQITKRHECWSGQ